jgi:protoporphyrinogen IX oxidase
MTQYYLWIKAFHIISVICWMAAMLYLPRLFIYHTQAKPGSEMSETFKVMERRLARYIMTPAMLSTYIFGLALIHIVGSPTWLQPSFLGKMAMVMGLTGVHGFLIRSQKKFAKDENTTSQTVFRVVNEIITVFMVTIIILIIVKPFN